VVQNLLEALCLEFKTAS